MIQKGYHNKIEILKAEFGTTVDTDNSYIQKLNFKPLFDKANPLPTNKTVTARMIQDVTFKRSKPGQEAVVILESDSKNKQ